ncbi:HPr family phosphocarrier protein [Aneurinibacillus terranovensis]|uniref:HPr family phosphocarrier protein n=1 Tax=Aneurinibacillus terranovensis TaxID=278991 RepID=UPI0004145BDE|nr:HPr family phosphocarrier protein [Aneurinibacillus terranovensis]
MVIEKELVVGREDGIHARPASELITKIKDFESSIEFQYGVKKINAKSILQLMGLAVQQGTVLKTIINGEDAEEALIFIEKFLQGER